MRWQRVSLKDLGQWYGGGTPSKANSGFWQGGSIPWLSPKDMGPTTLVSTQDHITPEAVSGSSVKTVPGGSVAVVVRSGILERTLPIALVPFETTLNQDMKAVLPREDIDARWIAWGLRAYERELLRDTRKAGTTVASIEMPRFHSFELPVPSLGEQRRIVDILEDHLSRLDAASRDLRTAEQRANSWRAGLVDALLWAPSWQTRELGALLREPMRNGRSDRAVTGPESGVRTLTLTAVTRNEFTNSNTKLTTTDPDAARGLWLEPGDILVQRANTPELVGTAARFEGPTDWAIFPDLLIRVRADEHVIDSAFMVAALRSERSHRALRSRAKGLAGSMPKIDQGALAAVQIPVPAVAEQRAVIDHLAAVNAATGALVTGVRAQDRRARLLRRALLSAAFSGKLTGRSTDQEVIEELANV